MAVNKISGFSTYSTNKLCGSTNVVSARIGSHLIAQPISYVSSQVANGSTIGVPSAELGDLIIVTATGSSNTAPSGYTTLKIDNGPGGYSTIAYKYFTTSDVLNLAWSGASYLAVAVFRNAAIISGTILTCNNSYCKAKGISAAAGNIGLVVCQYPGGQSGFQNSGSSGGYIMSANDAYNSHTVWYKSYTSAGTVGGDPYPYVWTGSGGYSSSKGFAVVLASA